MNKAEIIAKVNQIVSESVGIHSSQIKPEQKFVADLGMDSLDQVEFLMAIEDEFQIEVPDEVAEKAETVQQCYDLVATTLKIEDAVDAATVKARENEPSVPVNLDDL